MPTSTPAVLETWLQQSHDLLGLGLTRGYETVGTGYCVDQYELLERVGEGGLGEVWRAQQHEPMKRLVAVKIIRQGLQQQSEVVARFDLERQALARMSHRHIATMMDAGTMMDGRPYFVMELVSGVALTRYMAEHPLSLQQRLELFSHICLAVHHAHQKGVLHRDLKPSNILVTEASGTPEPKIIDFGIAKALDPADTELSNPLYATRVGDLPSATYPYMSPEQALGGSGEMDTRSDIYTLGVILYEMLCGQLPLPESVLKSGQFHEIARAVREVDPPAPSQKARSLHALSCPAAQLVGELDWITLRALAKEPERRYSSAAAFAEDIRRYLAHEPVTAGPPSLLYEMRKWVQRHRLLVASATAVLAALVIGFAFTYAALVRERQALQREAEQRTAAELARAAALARESEARTAQQAEQIAKQDALKAKDSAVLAQKEAVAARDVAQVARGRAEQLINDMLYDLRDELEPLGRVALLQQVADSAAHYFASVPAGTDSSQQQRNRAAMHQNRGSILLAKGDPKAALAEFRQSLAIVHQRARQAPQSVACLNDLALAQERLGMAHEQLADYTAAEQSYREMRRVFSHLTTDAVAKDGHWQADVQLSHERLGDLCRKRGQTADALPHYEAGLHLGSTASLRSALLAGKLGLAHEALGHVAEARAACLEELQMLTTLQQAQPQDAPLRAALALAHGHCAAVFCKGQPTVQQALQHAQTQQQMLGTLVQQDPLRVAWREALGIAYQQLGVAQELAEQQQAAALSYRAALQHLHQLPTLPQRAIATVQLRLAELLSGTERVALAHAAQQSLKQLPESAEKKALEARSSALLK